MRKNKLVFVSIIMLVALFGCQPATLTYYKGANAEDMDVVSLTASQKEVQNWQDLYVTVDYNLEKNGDQVDIDGVLTFSQSPKVNYTHVRDLKLKLFFLNKDLRVVDYLDVARTLSTDLEDETRFSKSIRVSPDVIALTFGYEGSFFDSDPEYPSSDMVWKLPKRNVQSK